jgi:hypothetical protein
MIFETKNLLFNKLNCYLKHESQILSIKIHTVKYFEASEEKGITCSNSDLRSLLSGNVETKEKVPRRRSLALLHRGSEVRGFAEPSTNFTVATGNGNKFEMLQPFTGFSPRRNRHKSRSLSLVTWDSDAKLAIGMYHVIFV